jgi:hypothetical protein
MRWQQRCRVVHDRRGTVPRGGVLVRIAAAVTGMKGRFLVDGGGSPVGLAGVNMSGSGRAMRGFSAFQRLLGP